MAIHVQRNRGRRAAVVAGASEALIGVGLLGAASPAHAAATIYVALSGSGGGSCATPDYSTIAAAVAAAATGDTIHVCAGGYALSSPVSVSKDLVFEGDGRALTIIDGQDVTRLFDIVAPATTATFNRLTMQNALPGSGNGGAVRAAASGQMITANDCSFTGNGGVAGGGAIFADGNVDVTDSTFVSNAATVYGGAIYSQGGAVTLTNSTFASNAATAAGSGAGAVIGSSITAAGSTFTGNTAIANGGALLAASVTVTSSTFTGNTALGGAGTGFGGAIWANTAAVTTSTFTANDADGGGAIGASGGIVVGRSTFDRNGDEGTYGGAIYSTGAVIQAWNSTFVDNVSALGGALMAASVAIASVTFSGNTAAIVGSAVLTGGPASTVNSVFSYAGANACWVYEPSWDSGGNVSSDSSCPGTITTAADLKLSPLADNGGPTQTMALMEGSSAIDVGIDGPCTGTPDEGIDQRGAPRTAGAACDAGAYEAGTFTLSGQEPPPWLQAYSRPGMTSTCVEGYSPSWAEWPNNGAGGFTCEKTTFWNVPTNGWVTKPGFTFRTKRHAG